MARTPAPLPPFPSQALECLLPLAFEEDEGTGDITTLATIGAEAMGRAVLKAKQAGVLAGLPAVEQVLRFRGVPTALAPRKRDGDALAPGELVLEMEGPLRGLLVCERILLNLLQRLSGIATSARAHAQALAGSPTRLLDTRKTLPGYRALEKYAVAVGGGMNHRLGLYDRILVKDNHARACGSVREAVERVRAAYGKTHPVEAEAGSLEELATLLDAPVDRVLLDNMDDDELAKAVALARKHAPGLELEASGNMTRERLERIKGLGLDYVSVGAVTHSAGALDLSLDFTA